MHNEMIARAVSYLGLYATCEMVICMPVFFRAIRVLFHLHRLVSWMRHAEYNENADPFL